MANLVRHIQSTKRLDWYHLKENLARVILPSNQFQEIESLLWSGHVNAALKFLRTLKISAAINFSNYLKRHKQRLINYSLYQQESVSSIGSGTIESGIKQIGRRVKISGAQWHIFNVLRILSLRCAYLNGTFS